jgi:hypothetical protein
MEHPEPMDGKRRCMQWLPGEILRFRANADLLPENRALRLTRVLVIEPAAWVEYEDGATREWRQLVRSLVRHEDRYARPEDLEPLPPEEAVGLLQFVRRCAAASASPPLWGESISADLS